MLAHTEQIAQPPTAQTLWSIVDGELSLNFHPGQTQAWDSTRRFVFVLAGTQGGKTSFGPWWLWREIYGDGDHPGRGPGDYMAITSSFDMFDLKMLPELKSVFIDILGCGRYWPGKRVIELADPSGRFHAVQSSDPMWGRIILRSAASPGGLEALTAKAAWLDEAGQDEFTLESWEAILRRLSLSVGRVLATTTLYNLGWIKSNVYDKWLDGDLDFDVIQFASIQNPTFSRAEFERARRSLPAWRFAMFYLGKFSRPLGLIYHNFNERTMLCDPFDIPAHWLRVVGVDPGGANVAALIFANKPQTSVWYLIAEELTGYKTSREYAQHVLTKYLSLPELEYQAVGGHASEGQARRDWAEGGLHIDEPPIANLEAGIDKCVEQLKRVELKVFRTCKGFLDEIGGYRRKVDEDGELTDAIVNKRKYHRLDAWRYAVQFMLEELLGSSEWDDNPISDWRG